MILLGLQLSLWFFGRFEPKELARSLHRIALVILFLLISSSFFESDGTTSAVWKLDFFGRDLTLFLSSFLSGLIISLRILILITSAVLVRISEPPHGFVEGLKGLRIPAAIAITFDATLALIAGRGDHKKRKKKFDFKRT